MECVGEVMKSVCLQVGGAEVFSATHFVGGAEDCETKLCKQKPIWPLDSRQKLDSFLNHCKDKAETLLIY